MQAEIGQRVSYYRDGWRMGTVQAFGKRGVLIRNPVTGDAWIPAHDVNALGDTTYHGPKALDVAQERTEQKRAEQAKADKLKVRRFHR
jgi:hypothetical protein